MYSKDYEEVKEVFFKWIKAWEEEKIEDMKECCISSLNSHISMFNPCTTWEQLKKYLLLSMGHNTKNWFEILSFVALVEENNAQQSANLIAIKSLNEGKELKYYQFAGLFCNSYIKTNEGWKISECRFDLFREFGNLDMAEGWNHMIPTIGWFEEIRLPVINGDLDAPWIRVENRDSVGTDEEQIEEIFYRYAFALDTCSFSLMKDLLAEDISVVMPPFGTMEKPMNKRDFMTTLMTHRHSERFMQHTGEFQSIHIKENGNEAKVIFYRKGDSGIKPMPIPSDNIRQKIATAVYKMIFIKAKNNQWQIKELNYEGKSFYYE